MLFGYEYKCGYDLHSYFLSRSLIHQTIKSFELLYTLLPLLIIKTKKNTMFRWTTIKFIVLLQMVVTKKLNFY